MFVALSPHAYCCFYIIEKRFFFLWPPLKVEKEKKAPEAASWKEMGLSVFLCEGFYDTPGHVP